MRDQVIKCLLERRSIRSLKPEPLPEKDIELMLRCMEAAPSAGNRQPWSFCVVKDRKVKEELCRLSFDQQAVAQAPVVFAVSAKPGESAEEYGELGADFFCIQDTAAAVENLLLAVHAMGYGAVWIGVVKAQEIKSLLGLGGDSRPVALVPVGFAAEEPKPMERKGLDKVTSYIN